MKRLIKSGESLRLVLVAGIVAVISGGTVAVADDFITSKDIKNGTIRPVDVSKKLRKKIYRKTGTLAAAIPGQNGRDGAPGARGRDGAPGLNGRDAEFEAGHWGLVARNTIGSAVADLQAGPFGSFGVTGPESAPPFGEGSLGLAVNDVAGKVEKAAFGNEVDFFGDPVLDLTDVGFHVFQTGENAGISPGNLPNITFEVDANLSGLPADNYSSLVFVPDPVTFSGGGSWSGYIDATSSGKWFLTGAEGNASPGTGCGLSLTCDFTQIMTALDDGGDEPVIYTAQVVKGRDNAWVGAVDGLRINDTIYDFEPLGVKEIPAP